MYYTHPCTYCRKMFYTYGNNRHNAAKILYHGIKKHLIDYNEDHREFELDDHPTIEINEIYADLVELDHPPTAGYEL